MAFSVTFEKEKKIFKPTIKTTFKSSPGQKLQIITKSELSEDKDGSTHNQVGRLVRRKHSNIFQHVYKFIPLTHIHNVYDLFGINEQTLRNPQNDESFFKTLFHLRSITRVEVGEDNVRVDLSTNTKFPNIGYIIERFNSYGNTYYHQIASRLGVLQKYNAQIDMNLHCHSYNPRQAVQRIAQKYKGKGYFIRMFPNTFFFSKELLHISGRTVDQFVQQCLQYKAFVFDFFTGENYPTVLEQTFDYMTYLYYLLSTGSPIIFSNQEMREMDHQTLLRGKDGARLFCKTKGVVSNPFVMTMVVDEIFRTEPYLPNNMLSQSEKDKYNADKLIEKEQLAEQMEFDLASEAKRCGFIPKPKQRKKKTKVDEDYHVSRCR